jgi:copper homeostasis protein
MATGSRHRALLEVCVDHYEAAKQAVTLGAHRLELCSRLDVGGLTPPDELIKSCLDNLRVPIHVMIRSREGDFVYNDGEVRYSEMSLYFLFCVGPYF